ncbi:hypothetical protein UlMin_043898 [Ulmus minor]
MEGQVPPATANKAANEDPSPLPPPPLPPPPLALEPHRHRETYVIQIPKNQIYRVPPPENALIVERFRHPETKPKNPCWPHLLLVAGILLLIGVLLGIAALTLHFFMNPNEPKFIVSHVIIKKHKSTSHNQMYEVSLKAKNPNGKVGIKYEIGGCTLLSFKQRTVAKGKFSTLYQQGNKENNMRVMLEGLHAALPRELAKNIGERKPKKRISLAMAIHVPVTMSFGFLNLWSKEILVDCKFKVSRMGEDRSKSKIVSQHCISNFMN